MRLIDGLEHTDELRDLVSAIRLKKTSVVDVGVATVPRPIDGASLAVQTFVVGEPDGNWIEQCAREDLSFDNERRLVVRQRAHRTSSKLAWLEVETNRAVLAR